MCLHCCGRSFPFSFLTLKPVGPRAAPAKASLGPGVSTFLLRSSGLARLALPPLGERVDRRQRSLQPVSRRGRVRGWWACARPFAVHIAPLKALGNDDATSSTFSRTLGTALRCLWFQGIDPRPQAGASPRPYRSRPFPFRRKRQPNCLRYPSRPRSRRTALEMVSSRSGRAEGSAGAALSRTLSPSPGARKRLDSTPCCRVYNS